MAKTPTPTHTVDRLIAHDRAVDLLIRSLGDPSLVKEAQLGLSQVGYLPGSDVAQELERGARLTIAGLARWDSLFKPVQEPADRRRFEEIAKAWLNWSNASHAEVPEETKSQAAGGGMNLMAYNLWAGAVRALVEDNVPEAERLYRRVLDLGAQYDIEHFRVIRLTYVASFFHHGLTSAG